MGDAALQHIAWRQRNFTRHFLARSSQKYDGGRGGAGYQTNQSSVYSAPQNQLTCLVLEPFGAKFTSDACGSDPSYAWKV